MVSDGGRKRWKRIADTIYPNGCGCCWSHTCPDVREAGAEWLAIIGNFGGAVFWILRTGAPWRDLPSDYGDWKNTQRRFCRWRDKGVWERLLDILIDEPDYEWLTIDASHIKVHPHGTGATGGNQQTGRTKGGLTPRYIWPWMRMVCRLESLSLKVPVLIARKLCH